MVDLREALRPAGTVTPLPISEIASRAGRRRRRRQVTIAAAALLATTGTTALIIDTVPRTNSAIVADTAEPLPSTTARPEPTEGPVPTASTTEPAGTGADTEPVPGDTRPTDAEPTEPQPADPTGTDTEPTDTEPTDIDPADTEPEAQEPGSEDTEPVTTPGFRTETTTTSRWEDGYCVEIEVSNDGETAARTWQVVLDLEGTIATLWSATVEDSTTGRFVFSGIDGYNATLGAGRITTFGACLDIEAG